MIERCLPGVSARTWRQRVQEDFELAGGHNMKLPVGTERNIVIDNSQFRATNSMMDEIHLMLRWLCDNELSKQETK